MKIICKMRIRDNSLEIGRGDTTKILKGKNAFVVIIL